MDEPTNHLDIGSCDALENALMAFEGTIVAVSHDRYFINRIATRIIELAPERDNGMIDYNLESYDEAFSEYIRIKELRAEALLNEKASATPQTTDSKAEYEERKREKAERRSEERKKERAEKRIAELEAEISALDEELFGEAASNYVRAAEIDQRKAEIEEELLELYEIIM